MLEGTEWRKDAEELMLRYLRVLNHHYEGLEKNLNSNLFFGQAATTPDKTVETFPCIFQFRAMQPSCRDGTKSPPSQLLVQCCFGLTAHVCILVLRQIALQ